MAIPPILFEVFVFEKTVMAGPIPIDLEFKVEIEIKFKITLTVDLTEEETSLELNPVATVRQSLIYQVYDYQLHFLSF